MRNAGGALVLRAGPWAETVLATAQAAGASRIHVADDVSGYASARLRQLEQDAAAAPITVVRRPGSPRSSPPPSAGRAAGRPDRRRGT